MQCLGRAYCFQWRVRSLSEEDAEPQYGVSLAGVFDTFSSNFDCAIERVSVMGFFEWAVCGFCVPSRSVFIAMTMTRLHIVLLRPVIWLGIVSLLMTVWTAGNSLYEFLS